MPYRLLALALLVHSPASGQPTPGSIDASFAAWSRRDTPGCVVGVARGGRDVLLRAYGMADLEHGVANTAQTVFEAGSVSKQFTAAAVLLLVEDGRLSLDDDVRRYLPELPDYGHRITIDHLLTHTSGLRDWGTVTALGGADRGSRTFREADVLDIVGRQGALNHEPGRYMSYNNTGYTLLPIVVARVTGTSFADFTRERLFQPLGMASTGWRDDYRRVVPDRAIGYRKSGTSFVQSMPFENTVGHGGLLTTVPDLLKWNEALSRGVPGARVGSMLEQRAVLATGRSVRYGRGLFINRHAEQRELSHGGTTAGYNAWLGRYPEAGLSVALLCNAPVNDVALGRQVADHFLPPQPRPAATPEVPRSAIALTSDQVAGLAGTFVSDVTGLPEIFTGSGGTVSNGGEAGKPVSANRVRFSWGDLVRLGHDRVALEETNGETRTYWRADGPLPSQARLSQLAGRYYSRDTAAIYEMGLADGRLTLRIVGIPSFMLRPTAVGPDVFRTETTLLRVYRTSAGTVRALSMSADRAREILLEPIRLPARDRGMLERPKSRPAPSARAARRSLRPRGSAVE